MNETVNHISKSQDKDKPWTREELRLRQGPVELAKAVIEQWKKDGCPKRDEQAIQYWKGVIQQYEN